MLSFEKLWQGKYISVISPKKYPYECVHESDVIMVFPIIAVKSKFVKGITDYYLGIRKENCPPYEVKDKNLNKYFYTSITGKRDVEGETAEQTMKREMIEEAGIKLIDYKLIFELKDMPLCKTTDLRATIYGIIIDSFEKVEATGDGTLNEKLSSTVFVNLNKMENILKKQNIDFLLYGGYKILEGVIDNFIQR